MDKAKILIVDDDAEIRSQIKWGLSPDYETFFAEERFGALEICKSELPLVVTLDLGLPPQPHDVAEGFLLLDDLLVINSRLKIIIVSGRSEKEHALEAIGRGAYDFLTKPFELEELKIIIKRAVHVAQLEQENHQLVKQVSGDSFSEMLGSSPQMQKVFEVIRKTATTDLSVLIVGESGTGKELAARAIHFLSNRRNNAFTAINCGAIPDSLLEAELFGHEKGAYTGAHIQRRGRVEAAHTGTLFLDEIGEISPQLQSKLLRFLQEQQIERIGGRESIFVDARVLAATNVDLDEALKKGRFREDLYYRLGVIVISLPPLRERGSDVPLLAKAFLQKYSMEIKKQMIHFTDQALQAIEYHSWPGNVRELKNRVRRAVVMADGMKVTPADLELDSQYAPPRGLNLNQARQALEEDMVQRALVRNRGNLTRAASDLGISRPSLYDLMNKLGIERK